MLTPDELDPLSCDDPEVPPAGGPGWGLTDAEYVANVRDWYADETATEPEPWPTPEEFNQMIPC